MGNSCSVVDVDEGPVLRRGGSRGNDDILTKQLLRNELKEIDIGVFDRPANIKVPRKPTETTPRA